MQLKVAYSVVGPSATHQMRRLNTLLRKTNAVAANCNRTLEPADWQKLEQLAW